MNKPERLIMGAGGGGKGGGSSHVATEDADSAASRAYAQVMDLISEGEVEGLVGGMQGVLLNGTPLQNPDGSFNFSGVSFAFNPGTQGQNYIAGFSDVENEHAVGLEVKQQQPLIRTITDTTVDAVRVTVNIPRLTNQDTKTGDIHGTSVDIAIDVQTSGGGYVQRIYDTIDAKISSNYERAYRIDLWGAGPWDVRVRRVTVDSTSSALVNNTYWASYTEIVDAKLTYPNSAVAALRVDAGQFSAIPSRAYHMRLLRIQVPSNYNPIQRTYSGAWDGTFKIAWSNNPAWCFYDLLTNSRYGLGAYISPSQVDKWSLYTIGQYCDQFVPDGFGGYEPRFTCNCYIQNYADAYKVVQDLASAFRGMVYWGGGTVTAVQDAPADPVALFTRANVVDGLFQYTGASLKARHTVALVSWSNLQDMGKTYVEYVEDTAGIARYGVITTQITAFGCTSRGQAHRAGKWILYSERMESETVTFKVGMDGAGVRPGDIIKVADAQRAGARMGGRVSAILGVNTFSVDSDLQDAQGNALNAVGSTLSIVAIDGTVRTGTVIAQNGRALGLSSSQGLSDMVSGVQSQAIWVLEPSTIQAQLFRVVQITETEGYQFEITSLATNPSKYNAIELGWALEVRDITDLSTTPSAPTAVTVAESLYLYQATVFSLVSISWPTVRGAISYRVAYSKDGANWVFATTPSNDFEIRAAASGAYTVRVWTIGANETQSSNYIETTQSVLGKSAPPADVQGLTYGMDQTAGAKLSWTPNTDVDLYGYEVRKGTSWASATSLGQMKATTFIVGVKGAAGTYLVKAIDTSGNYSTNAASVLVKAPQLPAPTVTGAFSGPNYNLSWVAVIGDLATDFYEIRTDTNWGVAAGLVTTQKGTSYSAKVNWSGSVVFYVAAVDIGGNYGAAGQATLVVSPPKQTTISQQVIDNNVLLRWADSTATLPIDHYVVARGATFAGATVIGNLSGTFDVIFETTPGTFTYWIAGVDSAGNQGPAASISAFVNQPPDYVLRYNYDANFAGLLDDFRKGAIPYDWAASGATLTAGNGGTLTSTGTAPQLIKTYQSIDQKPNGCEYPHVRVAVTRVAGSGWLGNLYWSTSGHGYSSSYKQTIATNPAIGTQTVLDFDMSAPAAGGSDWMNSVITGLRLDLGNTASDVFRVDFVELMPFIATNIATDADGSLVMPADTVSTFQQHFEGGNNQWATSNSLNATWGKSNATLTQGATDPNGNATAWTMTRVAAGNHYMNRAAPQAACAGLTYTGSVWMKSGTLTGTVNLWLKDGSGATIANTSVTPTATWTKYTVTGTAGASAPGAASLFIDPTNDAGAAGDTLFLWDEGLALGSTAAGWTSPNDQVASAPLYIEPGLTSATYVEYIDYGAILPASRVTVTPTYDIVDGAPALAVKIEVSADNSTWTAYNNTTAVYVSNFRYARYTVTVTGGTTGRDILRLKGINYRYDVKLKNDAGTIQAISTDVNGTPVTFNVGFIDVTSITVTANTTSPVFAVYNFQDVPNPTGFTVYLFDKNGNRVAGSVSWSAKGY
jgi:predicted phage tail protein